MAKANPNLTAQEIKAKIDALRQEQAQINANKKEYEKLIALGDKINQQQQIKLKLLQEERVKYTQNSNQLQYLNTQQQLLTNSIKDSLDFSEELDDSMQSLSSTMGKLPGIAKGINKAFDETKEKLSIVSDIIEDAVRNTNDLSDSQIAVAQAAGKAYANINITIADMAKKLADGVATQEQYNSAVEEAYKNFETLTDQIDASTESGKKLKEQFDNAKASMQGFADAAQKSQKRLDLLNEAMDQLGSSGIPIANELTNVFKDMANKGISGAKVAITALGAAIGKIAADYFAAPWQVDIEFRNERIENQINTLKKFGQVEVDVQAKGGTKAMTALPTDRGAAPQMQKVMEAATGKKASDVSMQDLYLAKERGAIDLDILKQKEDIQVDIDNIAKKNQRELEKSQKDNALELVKLQNEAAFAGERAANAFAASVKSAAAEFRAASKTALFGNKLGGVGYGAAQLQMAGISADKIAGAMSAASAVTGKMPLPEMGASMAIMAERTGTSVDNIASLNSLFQKTEGVTAEVAMNLTEGMRELANNSGIALDNLMQEVAESSKEALGYQIKSGKALAKQVAYAQSIGVNFGDIAKAGKSMVLNYQDSIKAEMQLSSLLGEQVDLSEVRAKFAEGDTQGALEALKAQGLNPEDMDMFQQEALSQALGGMDLSSLQKIATKTGKTGELGAGKAGAANQDFLSRSQQAQQALSAEQAQISADQAIIDAKTSQKALESLLKSDKYAKAQEDILNQQKLDADLEGQIRKDKVAAGLNGEILARELAQGKLESTYETLKDNLLTLNDNVREAAIQMKQLAPEKGFTENLISGLGAMVGGVSTNLLTNAIGNKLGKVKLPGKTTSFAEKRKIVAQRNAGAGGPTVGGGKKKGFKFGKKGKAGLIAMAGSLLLPAAVSAMSSGGGSQAEAGQEVQTIEPQTQMEMGGSSDICSCIGALQTGLDPLQGIQDTLYSSEQYQKDAFPALKEGMVSMTTDTLKYEAMELAITKGGEKLTQTFTKQAVKAVGTEAAEMAGKTIGTRFAASMGGKLMTKAMGGGPLGIVTGLVGGAASMYGEYKKEQAMQTGDMGALQTGRAADTAGTTLEYAGYGAALGSIVPGIGTAVGGAVGAAVGFMKGLWSNYFSEDAKKQEEAVLKQKENQEALQSLIAINESVDATFKRDQEAAARMADIADDEPAWREATLAQLVEMTRLSEMLLFKGEESGSVKVGGKEVTREYEGAYDKTKAVQARRLGKAEGLTDREKNIAAMQSAVAKGGGKAMMQSGKEMTWAEFEKTQGVTKAELEKLREKQQLLSIASETQAKKAEADATAQKGKTGAATATAGKATTTAGAATTTAGAAATTAGAAAAVSSGATEATLKLIQTQADTRGIIIGSKMDTINGTLNTLITWLETGKSNQFELMNTTLTSILTHFTSDAAAPTNAVQKTLDELAGQSSIQINAINAMGQALFKKSSELNVKSARNNFVLENVDRNIATLTNNTTALVKLNQNIQNLIDAMLTNNQNSGEIVLKIDGKPVSRMIKQRQQDRLGDPTADGTGGDTNN